MSAGLKLGTVSGRLAADRVLAPAFEDSIEEVVGCVGTVYASLGKWLSAW
jgi:hypothetical protein